MHPGQKIIDILFNLRVIFSPGLPRLMITFSNTQAVCLSIGLCPILQACPLHEPNQVRLRYVPFTAHRFLQTLPLPKTPLQFGLISLQTGHRRFLASGRGPGFAGQTYKTTKPRPMAGALCFTDMRQGIFSVDIPEFIQVRGWQLWSIFLWNWYPHDNYRYSSDP